MSEQRRRTVWRDGTPLCHSCGERMAYWGEEDGWEFWDCPACGCCAGFEVAALQEDEADDARRTLQRQLEKALYQGEEEGT